MLAMMEVDDDEGMTQEPPHPPSWFEFLLDKELLEKHLAKSSPDPSATTLLSQFIINYEKSAVDAAALPKPEEEEEEDAFLDEVPQIQFSAFTYRQKKTRTLRFVALQSAAFLAWDLDIISEIHISTQYAFMKQVLFVAKSETKDANELSREFLRILFYRWVLRVFQCQNLFARNTRFGPGEQYIVYESLWKELNEDEALSYLKDSVLKLKESKETMVVVPSMKTFQTEESPQWSVGTRIEKSALESIVHLDLGVHLLYKGVTSEAVTQFQQQNIPLENFPFLKISKPKLDGYLRAVGILQPPTECIGIAARTLDHERIKELALCLQKGLNPRLKKVLNLRLDPPPKTQDRLNTDKRDDEEGAFIIPGDDKLSLFSLEKRLIESTNPSEIEMCIGKLLGPSVHQGSVQRTLSTLFSGWELPIPVQHAVKSLNGGNSAFQDHIYILVAKSRQLLNCKEYAEARRMLQTVKTKLQQKFQQTYSGGINPYVINLDKLVIMMDWEILLLDITQFVSEYPDGLGENDIVGLKNRCRECLEQLQDPKTEVNPRSEIVENILVAFINLGEYHYVANFDKMQNPRWPFVEFIALLSRACHDLFLDRKESSSSYRELWSAVLPVFSSTPSSGGSSTKKQVMTGSGKPSMLTSRASLSWIIDRSCSQHLLSVWVSLLARLHNHIVDDVGVQIHADFLHIWPNILDDVTSSSAVAELKASRVAGSSKLNSKHIRDFLFTVLERATKISRGAEVVIWLRCLGDVHLASGAPSLAMKVYLEYLAVHTDFFEKANAPIWGDAKLFKRMIKCCELLGSFTQAMILCQFLYPEVDYSVAFGMAQEKVTNDSSDSLYGFIWDLTILEFLINLHTKRNEMSKRQQAIKVMGLLELNSNNNEEIQHEAMSLRRAQFMRTLAKHYIFV